MFGYDDMKNILNEFGTCAAGITGVETLDGVDNMRKGNKKSKMRNKKLKAKTISRR